MKKNKNGMLLLLSFIMIIIVGFTFTACSDENSANDKLYTIVREPHLQYVSPANLTSSINGGMYCIATSVESNIDGDISFYMTFTYQEKTYKSSTYTIVPNHGIVVYIEIGKGMYMFLQNNPDCGSIMYYATAI